jgi:hypothetical protein
MTAEETEMFFRIGSLVADFVIKEVTSVVNASQAHTEAEKEAMIASLRPRIDAGAAEVAAVKFKDV